MELAAMGSTLVIVASIWIICGVIYYVVSRRRNQRIEDIRRAAGLIDEEENDGMV